MLEARPDVVVVRDAARLGRHPRQYVALLDSKAKVAEWLDDDGDANLDVPLVNPDTDESADKTTASRSYSRKISKGVKRELRTKAARGAWRHGGTRPFGYHHPGPKSACCPPGPRNCTPGCRRHRLFTDMSHRVREGLARTR